MQVKMNHEEDIFDGSMELAYVALGSNLGNREAYLVAALRQMNAYPGIEVIACSPVYQTKPMGVLEQPQFLNMVALLRTNLDAHAFFSCMMETEQALGRTRDIHWGPRTIDLDLLWFGEQTIDSDVLTVPHPHMFDRSFVLQPLLDLVNRFSPNRAPELLARIQKSTDREEMEQWTSIDWQTASGHSAN